jgi:hypothetical protein
VAERITVKEQASVEIGDGDRDGIDFLDERGCRHAAEYCPESSSCGLRRGWPGRPRCPPLWPELVSEIERHAV